MRYLTPVVIRPSDTTGVFYQYGITLISAWISNYIHDKMWDEITNPFPNLNNGTVEVCEWMSKFTHTLLNMQLFIHAGVRRNPC